MIVLLRLVETGTLAVAVGIAGSEPVTAYLDNTPTVPAQTLPSHLIALDFRIDDSPEDKEVPKFLPRQIIFERRAAAAS